MTQFHEGQEVEVQTTIRTCGNPDVILWRKAKIVSRLTYTPPSYYRVEFTDGTQTDPRQDLIRWFVSDEQIAAYIKKIGDQDKADCIE